MPSSGADGEAVPSKPVRLTDSPPTIKALNLASSDAFVAAFVTVNVYVFVATKFAAVTFIVMTFAPSSNATILDVRDISAPNLPCSLVRLL